MRTQVLMASTAVGGGTRVLLELANRLPGAHVVSFGPKPDWFDLGVPFAQARDFPQKFSGQRILLSHLNLLPWVLTRSRAPVAVLCQSYEPFQTGPNRPIYQELLDLPFTLIATSRPLARLLAQLGRPSIYLQLALDRQHFQPRRRTRKGAFRILWIGDDRLPVKDFAAVVKALETLDFAYVLVMVSRNPNPPEVPFQVEHHHNPPRQQLGSIIAGCDVLCSSSRYESLGLPPLEAMACGVPVLCSRNGGVEEYGHDEHNLLLVEPGSPTELAEGLRRLQAQPRLAQRLRARGLETVGCLPDWDTVAGRLQAVLERLEVQPAVDQARLEDLAARLVEGGHFTPPQVERTANRIERALRQQLEVGLDPVRLSQLRDEAATLAACPGACQAVFKAQYDLCQVLLTFPESRQRLQAKLS
ncbi:MAG: glycosyltransferase family 4 protein [Vulcanimicrobiota bacterium]